MIATYLEELRRKKRYAPTTMIILKTWLEQLQDYCSGAGLDLKRLTPDDLTRWRQELTWKPGPSGKLYAENTVNQAVGAVRRFFEWTVERGVYEKSPAAHLKTRGIPKKKRAKLSPSEVRKLLDAPDPESATGARDRAVLGVLLEAQINHQTCSRIDLNHLQMDTGALLTHGRVRQVHCLSDGLLGDLERYLEFGRPRVDEPALFLNVHGRRLTGPAIHELVRKHARRAGVPRV